MATVAVADGVELFYSDSGDGPAVVMLHGWTCDGTDWSWLASDFEVDHRVVVPDLRGHGRSTRKVDNFGMEILAEDVAALLRNLDLERVIVVGHSMGTVVASVLAIEHPDLVAALVLVDPKYGIADENAEPLCAGMIADASATTPAIFDRFYLPDSPAWQRFWHLRRALSMPDHELNVMFQAMFGPGKLGRRSAAEPQLGRRPCPVLAVYSELFVDLANWESTLPHGPLDQVVVSPGGHFLHQERPEEFAQLVRAWLQKLHDTPIG
ncbi:MAG: alpha/beta hydrolase [Mycobacterium sp.]